MTMFGETKITIKLFLDRSASVVFYHSTVVELEIASDVYIICKPNTTLVVQMEESEASMAKEMACRFVLSLVPHAKG